MLILRLGMKTLKMIGGVRMEWGMGGVGILVRV